VARVERQIEGLEPALVERIVERVLTLEPRSAATLVIGSYAKGTASETSDLDLVAITPAPQQPYRTWFEDRRPEPPLHVSLGSKTADERRRTSSSAARWAFGFPAIQTASYVWAEEDAREQLGGDPSLHHPAAEPELEDFVEFVLKAKRSARDGDEIGLRWFAHSAAELAPSLLVPLNDQRTVYDRRDAIDAALSLRAAPDGYSRDLAVCLGLASASTPEVKTAVARLGSEILGFVRAHAPEANVPDYLADGTLERHLGLIE
jgi:phosphoribosyl-AMP cyclohydrolase